MSADEILADVFEIARQVAAEIQLPPDEVRDVERDATWLLGNPSFLLIARVAVAAGRAAAAADIRAHAENIGWYEGGGVWADAIEIAEGAEWAAKRAEGGEPNE